MTVAAALLLLIAVGTYLTWPRPLGFVLDIYGVSTVRKNIPLTLPRGPSIAVLPFENASGDPEQEYFSDGLTEDIITNLSKFEELFVIARHSTSQYKGYKARYGDVRDVGRDLGVRYVLEGSVRKSGERIRVTAQLSDASDGRQLWGESYDRDLTASELFQLQDERSSVPSREPTACSLAPDSRKLDARLLRTLKPMIAFCVPTNICIFTRPRSI
jgi:TolB-like protein